MQPQDVNDEKMHIERDEDETTMGEGAVAVEGEATSKEQARAESCQQPQAQSNTLTQMAQVPRTAFYDEQ